MAQLAQILAKTAQEIFVNLMMGLVLMKEIVKIINFMKINVKHPVKILVLHAIHAIKMEFVKIAQMIYIMELIAKILVINALHLLVIWKEIVQILLLIAKIKRHMDQNVKMNVQKLVLIVLNVPEIKPAKNV
jgi:cellulose synthase/poly-beta-1,6-N-acetylglucosamine synthase-like glycosyltransferase